MARQRLDDSNASVINLYRGDSLICSCFCNAGTKIDPVRYILSGNDKLYFGVMEPGHKFEQSIVKKIFDANSEKDEFGDTLIKLNPKDTEYLEPGVYYYSIKLYQDIDGEEYVTTIIDNTLFRII